MTALISKTTSKHDGEFYYLNFLSSSKSQNKLKEHENFCKIHDYSSIGMPKEQSIWKYGHGEKSMTILFIIYADMGSLIEKINKYQSNHEKSSLTKINNDLASGYSFLTHRSFHATKTSIIIKKEMIYYTCKEEFNTDNNDTK